MEPIIISASFFQEQLYLGVLGRTGEHEARRISFDCSEVLNTWPEATILCVCRRPCDTAAYPIPLTADGTTYTMPLMSRETAAAGTIKLELRAVRDDTVLKSAIFYGRILPSLNGQKDAPGNPLSDALNRLESTIADAQTLADEIRQKLDNGEFKGDKGEPGAKGDKGEKGDKGDKGDPGSDATVTAENIQSALGYAPVKDVQANGTSILTNGVADIPKAETGKLGLTSCSNPWVGGLYVGTDGIMRIVQAPPTDIDSRATAPRPVTGNNLDYAVKAAMCDGKGAAWTADEQKAARERMGVDKEYELIEEITLTENATQIIRTDEPDGTAYAFERVAIKINRTNTGEGGVYVYSGSTVLGWSYLSSSGQYFACETFSLHGYWQNYRYSASSGHNDYNNIAPSGDSRFLKIKKVAGQYVSKIQITMMNAEFGIGTKISIYGVRA